MKIIDIRVKLPDHKYHALELLAEILGISPNQPEVMIETLVDHYGWRVLDKLPMHKVGVSCTESF